MVKNILPGTGNTGNVMVPLIPFNMIVDTDVGLLSLIYKSFMDPKIFNKNFFIGKKVNELVQELYLRRDENPLLLCTNEEYKNSCDNLYNQFMNDYYKEILDLSVITEFYNLVGMFMSDSDIKLSIVCEKDEEINLLKSQESTKDCKFILADDIKPNIIKSHNQFFFKSIPDATPYTKYMINKTIYFANYGFNKEEDGRMKNHPLIPIIIENNIINIIDVYRSND